MSKPENNFTINIENNIRMKIKFPFILLLKEDIDKRNYKRARINMIYELTDTEEQYTSPLLEFICEECILQPELNYIQVKYYNKTYYKIVPFDPNFVARLKNRYGTGIFSIPEDKNLKNQFNFI